MKKLPENPFKEADKLAEKLTLDIANKTDKALIESLNDLINQGLLEVRIMNPTTIQDLKNYTVKSGVQVVPKFDEYTKKLESENLQLKEELSDEIFKHCKTEFRLEMLEDKYIQLESENSELKKQLIHLSEQQTERIQRTINDKQYIMKLEAEVESLKDRIESDNQLIKKLADSEFNLKFENQQLIETCHQSLDELAEFKSFFIILNKFLKLEK